MKASITKHKENIIRFSLYIFFIYFMLFSEASLFALQSETLWNGQINSDWHNADNWTNGVPNPEVSAVIFMHSPNYPVINATASCFNIEIQNCSFLYINGYNELHVYGNWTNSHTFTADKGTVVFHGDNSSINGVNNIFFNLAVKKNGNALMLQLNSDITVCNHLLIHQGDIFLNNHQLDLKNSGQIIGECNENRIYDDSENGKGTIIIEKNYKTPGYVETFGNIGIIITAEQCMGNTQIIRSHKKQFIDKNEISIYRYFDIIPENNTNLQAKLTYMFFDEELPIGINKEELVFFASEDSGFTWKNRQGTVYPHINSISKSGIDQFSRWTASDYSGLPSGITYQNTGKPVLKIYPNPACNFLNIECDTHDGIYIATITDINGNEQHSFILNNNITIEVSKFSAGLYYLSVTNIQTGSCYSKPVLINR